MPNWANTHIMFFSKNKQQLEDLCKVIQDAPETYEKELKRDLEKNTISPIGNSWIGAILYKLNMITKDQVIKDDIPSHLKCRGRVIDQDYEVEEDEDDNPYLDNEPGYHFSIQTEDAWQPETNTWDQILMEHFPDVAFVYVSEEPGNGYYDNSDEYRFYWKDDYHLDISINVDDVSPRLQYILKKDCPDFIEEYCSLSFDEALNFFKRTFKGFEHCNDKDELEDRVAELEDMAEEGENPDDNWIHLRAYTD